MLLVGLQAAKQVDASKVVINSDSQLATQQSKDSFEINNGWLRRYAKIYEETKAKFQEVVLQKIPRAEN